jgi:hypothetical protein
VVAVAVKMWIVIFWVVPCSLVGGYHDDTTQKTTIDKNGKDYSSGTQIFSKGAALYNRTE